MMKQYYSITAKADKKAEILIYEQIGESFWDDSGVGAKRFAEDLKALGDITEITVRINSPGGSVFEGNTIYNVLRAHKAKVIVTIDGLAASIASVIAMAGESIIMPENAMMMIHDPAGLAMGTADDMLKMAEALGKIKTSLVAAYSTKANIDDAQIIEMMTEETWLTAAEAVEIGLADEVAAPVQMAAAYDLSMFKHPPKNLTGVVFPHAAVKAGLSGKLTSLQEENPMTEITRDSIAKDHPEIANSFREEGREEVRSNIATDSRVVALVTAAKTDGAKGEHKRIADVEAALIPGHEALIAEMVADGTTTGPEAAMRVVQAENAARKGKLDALKSDGEGVAAVGNAAAPDLPAGVDKNLPLEDRCKAAWKASPELRAEFSSYENYVACCKAEEGQQVKVLGETAAA